MTTDACRRVHDLDALVRANETFACVYLDPPWRYDNTASRGAAENHYPTMGLDEIAALPVGRLAADESHLHLWATDSFLEPAIGLLKGWGFAFAGSLVWVKPQLGTGNYWRSSHEYMLLGVRGGLPFLRDDVPSWLEHKRGKHSAKPEAVRALVERVSPGPRIELFARRLAHGWASWGNEIEKRLFDDLTIEGEAP